MTKLSIIILSYNTKDLLVNCIHSLSSQYKRQFDNNYFEIIIVDNKSSDDTVSVIKSEHQNTFTTLIENEKNYGFSKGCNIGAQQAKGNFLFFLNSDTTVEDSGLLKMIEHMEQNKNVSILGARLKNKDETDQKSAGTFYNILQVILMLLGLERTGFLRFSPKQIEKVDWVSGGAMMIEKDVFEKIGGFDEKFFMYIEDMEFCFRAKKTGYSTYFFPFVSIVHTSHGSSSRSFAIKNIYKGLLYFYKIHKSPLEYAIVKLVLLLKARLLVFLGRLLHNTYLTKTYEETLASAF